MYKQLVQHRKNVITLNSSCLSQYTPTSGSITTFSFAYPFLSTEFIICHQLNQITSRNVELWIPDRKVFQVQWIRNKELGKKSHNSKETTEEVNFHLAIWGSKATIVKTNTLCTNQLDDSWQLTQLHKN